MTNKFDINILINNYDILRKSKGLNKGEFNKLIGMANVYRPNYFSIGAKLLKGITDNYPGITEEWLLTPHDPNYEFPEIQKLKQADHSDSAYVNEAQAPYHQIIKISDPLIHKTAAILESPTIYSTALKSNIEAFHHAMTCEEQLDLANKRIDTLEDHVKAIETRLPKVNESS